MASLATMFGTYSNFTAGIIGAAYGLRLAQDLRDFYCY